MMGRIIMRHEFAKHVSRVMALLLVYLGMYCSTNGIAEVKRNFFASHLQPLSAQDVIKSSPHLFLNVQ